MTESFEELIVKAFNAASKKEQKDLYKVQCVFQAVSKATKQQGILYDKWIKPITVGCNIESYVRQVKEDVEIPENIKPYVWEYSNGSLSVQTGIGIVKSIDFENQTVTAEFETWIQLNAYVKDELNVKMDYDKLNIPVKKDVYGCPYTKLATRVTKTFNVKDVTLRK